jgi:hypothetical protein
MSYQLVFGYKSGETRHLAEPNGYDTLCGLNREDWSIARNAELRTDIDAPFLCKRCRAVVLR